MLTQESIVNSIIINITGKFTTVLIYLQYWKLFFRLNEKKKNIFRVRKTQVTTFADAKRHHIPRTRHTSDDFAGLLLEKAEGRSHGASSPAINIPRSPTGEDVASSVGCYPVIGLYSKLKIQSNFPMWSPVLKGHIFLVLLLVFTRQGNRASGFWHSLLKPV